MSNYCEKTLRKKARNIGYSIHKGLQHHICCEGYPVALPRTVGYNVVDDTTGYTVWGSYDQHYDHLWNLEDVEEFLRGQYQELDLDF